MSNQYYIHDTTRGWVGNSLVWWAKNHHGYTCDIRKAHVFTKAEAIERINDADDLVAYPDTAVLNVIEHHVTRGDLLVPLTVPVPIKENEA